LVVRNDVRSQVLAEVDNVEGAATEDFLVLALESATIEATLSGETTSLAAEEESEAEPAATEPAVDPAVDPDADPAAAETATASPLALNGLIATNLVLSEANAKITHSALTVDGNLSVQADNISTITAENTASLESDGTAVGVTLAFNTIGWKPQNLFANAIDALLGSDALGTEQPAVVSAMVLDTAFTVGGDVAVTAGGLDEDPDGAVGSTITATISNETTANAASASASFDTAVSFVRASPSAASAAPAVASSAAAAADARAPDTAAATISRSSGAAAVASSAEARSSTSASGEGASSVSIAACARARARPCPGEPAVLLPEPAAKLTCRCALQTGQVGSRDCATHLSRHCA
jgi:hypothetical protein